MKIQTIISALAFLMFPTFTLQAQPDTMITTTGTNSIGSVGVYSKSNYSGFTAVDSSFIGFRSIHNLEGFIASDCDDGGFFAKGNFIGFHAKQNSSHGFLTSSNNKDGFHSDLSGQHAGYFSNNANSGFPSVFIAHGDDDSTDLKFGGRGLITSESQQIDILGGFRSTRIQ